MALARACFLLLLTAAVLATDRAPSRGFGDEIEWYTMEGGLAKAKAENKPIMVLVHKSWCGACKALKPQFAGSKEIEELSRSFVMINTEDAEEPTDAQFKPDGTYIPRIFFLNSEGKVDPNMKNALGNPKYSYFYSQASQVVASMKAFLAA
eukprot:TRINITY_DN10787_c0_g1_i1.p1 TRINITY_DN10787_c0_g1~~TRINITY_DN10787_c0_g1_i1.p1  ORF type:complete len:151 (-),score=28.09 TRINITY_DN10787_c0_g1_i1:12-464(-)